MITQHKTLEYWMESKGYTLPLVNISNTYLPARRSDRIVYVSSATPLRVDGSEVVGKIGSEVDEELAKEAACLCLAHSLSLLKGVVQGPLGPRIHRIIDFTFLMNCVSDFDDHSTIADAASNLLVEYFGDDGKHSRSAIGVGSLVRNCSMVLKAVYELRY